MNVTFRSQFLKDIKKIKNKRTRSQVEESIDNVKAAKSVNEIADLKKLKGQKGYFRIRIGEYRIGIKLIEDSVIFSRVLHRKDIYRYFP